MTETTTRTSKSPDSSLQEGDKVSWKWGHSTPTGTVAEVKTAGQLEITTAGGKHVHRNADEENPAVHVARGKGEGSGNDVVKRASELTKEGAGEASSDRDGGSKGDEEEPASDGETGTKANGAPAGDAEETSTKQRVPHKGSKASATKDKVGEEPERESDTELQKGGPEEDSKKRKRVSTKGKKEKIGAEPDASVARPKKSSKASRADSAVGRGGPDVNADSVAGRTRSKDV